jgi:membrane dipeptidase
MRQNVNKDIVIVDGHADIPRDIYLRETNGEQDVFRNNHYYQLKKSKVNVVFANIFTKCLPRDSLKEALLQVEKVFRLEVENDDVVLIKNTFDLESVLQTGKIGIVLCLEGFEPLLGSLELLSIFFELGIRGAMFTWNSSNLFASGVEQIDGGLTQLGKLAVKNMNELGIIIDVSHLNEKGFWDVLELNKKPTIASHSNSRALFNHPRNLTDKQISAIAEKGGVVGAFPYFSKVNKENSYELRHSDDSSETIYDFIEQIEYIVNIVGYDHVAMGFDFNMYLGDFGVKGLESAEKITDVNDLLIKRGHHIEDVKKIAGGNWIRILNSVLPPLNKRGEDL